MGGFLVKINDRGAIVAYQTRNNTRYMEDRDITTIAPRTWAGGTAQKTRKQIRKKKKSDWNKPGRHAEKDEADGEGLGSQLPATERRSVPSALRQRSKMICGSERDKALKTKTKGDTAGRFKKATILGGRGGTLKNVRTRPPENEKPTLKAVITSNSTVATKLRKKVMAQGGKTHYHLLKP